MCDTGLLLGLCGPWRLPYAFVTAKCKLWPKQFNHSQFNFLTAATMLAPLSVVMHASFFSYRDHSSNACRRASEISRQRDFRVYQLWQKSSQHSWARFWSLSWLCCTFSAQLFLKSRFCWYRLSNFWSIDLNAGFSTVLNGTISWTKYCVTAAVRHLCLLLSRLYFTDFAKASSCS